MRAGIAVAGIRSAPDVPTLLGRRDACVRLDGLLDGARSGRSGVLILRGEAGVGKTALLEYAIESAADHRLLRAEGETATKIATQAYLRAGRRCDRQRRAELFEALAVSA